jgi:ATP-dependent DNA helicase RecG
LRHKSVFSEADQKWLDGFKPLKLTRNEMLVALMGKDGGLLSPQAIYERLGLVDWDIYREIIDQLYSKAVIRTAISESKKVNSARSKRVSQREIPRIAVRRPEELERGLSELFASLKAQGPVPALNRKYAYDVLNRLSVGNPYKGDHAHLYVLLKVLGMIDDQRAPTSLLINVWGRMPAGALQQDQQALSKAVSKPKPLLRQSDRRVAKPAVKASRDIYVGNLDYGVSAKELTAHFAKFGVVLSVRIPPDFASQRGRGFGFITMQTDEQATAAIEGLNGTSFRGRVLRVKWEA